MLNARVKIPVSRHGLLLRLRRVLRPKGEDVRQATPDQQRALKLGRYYHVGPSGVLDKSVDLEKLARKVGALDPWEELKE